MEAFNLRSFLFKGAHLTVISGLSSLLSIASVLLVYKIVDVAAVAVFFSSLSALMVVNRVVVVNPWQTIIKYANDENYAPYEQCLTLDVISALVSALALYFILNCWFASGSSLLFTGLMTTILLAKTTGVFVGGLRLYGYFNSVEYIKFGAEFAKLILVGLAFVFDIGSLEAIALAFAISELLKFVPILGLWLYAKNANNVKLSGKRFFKIDKEIVRYSLYANFNGSLVGSIKLGDVALLAVVAEDSAVALYKLIRVVSSAMGLVTDPMQVLIFPDLVRRIKQNSLAGMKAALKTFHIVLLLLSIVVIIVTLALWPIVTFYLLGYVEQLELVYLLIMLVAVLLQINFFYLQPVLMAANKVSEIFLINLKAVFVYGLSFICIQFYSPLLAIIIAYLLFSYYSVYSRWKLVRANDI